MPKRGASSLAALIAFRVQAPLLGYLLVLLVLGAIALIRAPGADIPQVLASLRDWLRAP